MFSINIAIYSCVLSIFTTTSNIYNYQYHFRWQPTRAPNPWEGILQATSHGPVCPQRFPVDMRSEKGLADAVLRMPKQRLRQLQLFRSQLLRQSEDCLYLNIFVPLKIPYSGNARGRGKLLWYIFWHVASNKLVLRSLCYTKLHNCLLFLRFSIEYSS